MAERRAATKGRRMGSSRRRQLQESSGEAPAAAPSPSEEPPGTSEMVQRMQDFFRKQDKDQAGFVTRSDMQKLQEEDFPCSTEELELIFDGLDAAGTGRLSTEEFTAGLWQFLSSQKATRNHRRRKTASRRVRLVLPSPALDGADSEEQRHFAAFIEQLGMDNVSEEQEIWQLWVKLREDEPQLLGNLEDFLAKMRHRIQEARSKKEALKATLNKRVAEHDKEVQQLCEVLEQQIQQEQQRLEQQSVARSHQHGMELQRALDASEREVQRLVMVQMELETQCRSLRSMQQATSTENQQLEESNRVLEDRLQHLHQQLQQTHGRLQTARAAVAWENMEEPGDRVAAELPSEMPPSPQMSPEKSEKNRSEMRTRLGSQSGKPKVKSTHQVVWEMLPAEISLLGAPPRASSTEEDPFPEFLKEEHFSNQSSLLREMNDAIAALSKQLKPQAPGTPPVPADAACHPQDDDEPQTGPEAATAHGTTPGVLQETLPSHVAHKPFEGDLKERPAAAELCAPDTTQAGASVGARHRRALEPGAEQGESPEDARRMLFLQGKGTGVEELMLKAAQHLQEAPGESTEAGEQALMEVEGEGWMQEKIGWEKVQPPGEAEEVALSQGENLETGLGPPEPGEAGLAAGWQLAADELGPAVAPGEHAQPLDVGLGEEPDLPSGLSEKLEIKPGEHLEPEPPSQVEARMGAARKDGVLPEVTVAPGPGMLEEERVSAEVQPQGETLDADVLPAPAQHGGSSRARAEEGEVEVTQPREAEPQPQGESARGEAGWGGSVGAEVPLPAAVPPADTQEGGAGTDVQPLEAQSNDANMQLLAELKAALQPLSEAGSLGTEQGGSVAPGVQPLEKDDKPELGLGEEMGAAAVCGEGPSPAETPAGSPDLGGLFPVKAQALETVETEDSQADTQLHGGAGPETLQGGGDCAAIHLLEEAEDGEQEHGECGLPQEALLYPHGVTIRQGEGAAAGVQSPEEAVMLDMLEVQSSDANVQLLAEVDEIRLTPGGSSETDLQLPSEVRSPGTEQGGSVAPDVQPLGQVDTPELVEVVEAEDSWAEMQLHGRASPETPQGGEDRVAMQLGEEAEDGEQEQGEHGLPHEPVLDPQGTGVGQGEGDDAGVQPPEEAVIPDTLEVQSSDANMQPLAMVDELEMTPGGSTEADLQPLSEVSSLDTEQGGSVAPYVHPLDQVDKHDKQELVELEAEDSWVYTRLRGGLGPEAPRGRKPRRAVRLGDEAEDEGQGLGEHGLPHESVLGPQGAGVGQGEVADAGVHLWDSGESLDLLEDESTDANVQPLAEVDELEMTPGGSSETDLQSLTEAGSFGTEQGGSLAPDVQPLDQVDTPDLVELEAEDSRVDMQLHWCPGPEAPRGRKTRRAVQLRDEAEDGGQGLGEHGLPHESVLDPQGAGVGQGEVADAGVQLWDSGESLDLLEDQSTDANVQQPAEADELRLTPGASSETDLQLPSEVRSPGTEQGGSMAPDVQPLDQVDTPESVEMVEAEDSWTDTQLHGGASPETPQGGEDRVAMQLGEEAEDGEQGQDEHGLPHEPVLDLQGAGVGQGEGADAGVQPPEEAVIMDTLEVQSSDANMQLLAKVDEPRLTPGGSTEADLQPLGEVSSLRTEQGGSLAPDVQPLDQADKQELVEIVEAEDSWAEMQLHWCPGPEAPWGRKTRRAVQLGEEAEDEGQGLGEHGLPHESVLDPQGAGVGQGEGADAGVQLWESAESLDILEVQSTDTNVQQPAEADELEMTPGGSMDADLQLPSVVRSPGTEQGGSVATDVQPLDQVDTPDLVEMVEVEDSWAEMQLRGRASPETSQGGGDHAARQLGDEAEDGGQGLGEHGLPHESVLGPQGAGVGQGEVADAGVQLWDSGESLDLLEDQSTDANVQQPAEADELEMTPGGSTEADLQLPSEVRSLGTEQGGSMAPDVQPLDQVDTPELVEMVEAEDSWADTQLHGGASPETLQRGSDHAAMQLGEEAEDGEQGQGEHGLPHEPVLDLQGAGVGCEEGAGAGVQPPEEAVIMDTLEVQSSDANMQPLAMVDELRLTPGVSTETGLQPLSEVSSLGTEQGGSVAPYVHPLDQVDKHDKQELVELEAEDSWVYTRLRGGLGPEAPRGRKNRRAVQLRDEAEDGGQGLGEHGLPHETVLDPQGAGVGQGEGADAGVQLWQLAESLDLLEDESTDANVQPLAEVDELRLTPGASSETDLQLPSEVRSPGTEQGGSVAPDVQPLDQVDTPESVEMVEAEDSWTDTQLHGGASPETPQGGEDRVAMQLGEEAEDGEQGQDERGLPHKPVLHLQGAGVGQGEGAGAGVQPPEEAVIPDTLEIQRTDVNVQLLTEAEELKSTSAGSTEADLAHLDATGMWEGEQSQPPCLEAGLRAAHAVDTWEGAAGGCVSPPLEAASYPECAAAAEGPGLEVKLGALTGPHGQILENTQTLELPQGERAAAEGRLLDGAQGLEVVQGERLEAGVSLVETQGLGLKQGRDDGAFELASQVFEVPLQISTLKLETMMQKDVLIPDVRRLGASGQAVQSELQEQVSAQADKVRLHTASQQLKEKPLHVMETEQVAAGPAEPPKQEMPSGPILHMRVQQEEDAGNDQLGMVLGDSSLRDAGNSSMQPQKQHLGEQSEDLNVDQWEKKQEVGRKTSQKGELSPGKPGAVSAGGGGPAPRGSPEASLEPDHLYNVLFVGDSHVGKTSFLYRLHADTFNPDLTATVGLDYQVKNLIVDNKRFALRLWDSAGQERYHSMTKQFFRKADGIVLMYDITSEYSFSDMRYWLSCIQEGAEDGVAILLLGNKTDCAEDRKVPTEEGERLAKEHQLTFYECSAASGHNVLESMVSLIRLLKVREDESKNKAAEVPKPPQKKKGCCW